MKTLTVLLLVLTPIFQAQTEKTIIMDTQVIEKFHVIGISIRTKNENGQASPDIEALWGKFWNEDIKSKIPNAINDDIYAIYTDYETDYNGAYTMIIGLSVNSLDHIPEGFVGMTIEKSKYQKIVSKGKMPEAILNTWIEIWGNNKLNRAYQTDFTIHGKKYYDGDEAEVETFISVKP